MAFIRAIFDKTQKLRIWVFGSTDENGTEICLAFV
jgi:hypothetical protein